MTGKINKSRNLEPLLAAITIVVAILAWQFPKQVTHKASIPSHIKAQLFQEAFLNVSGSAVSLNIKEGAANIPLRTATISSSGSVETIYLPKGQVLSLRLSGSGIQVRAERSIAPQIQVNDTGAANNILTY